MDLLIAGRPHAHGARPSSMNPADLAGLDEQLAAVKVRTISPPESDLDTPHAAEGDTAAYATEGDTAAFAANDTGDSASGIIQTGAESHAGAAGPAPPT
jgi:hypothetical protein